MGKIINTENAPKPVGPYSQAVKAGEFLFISGQVAIDPKVGKITASDVKGQTERVMENVKAILAASGYGLKDIVQTNVYLTSMTLFGDFNIVYAKYFDRDFPARATVGIALMPGALVEVSAVAYKEKE
jgi:2-iminobutanoate/2-iminopropanoate deaminase